MEEHVCCHLTASKRQQTVFVLIPLRWRFSPIGSALSRIFQRKSFSIGEARGGGGVQTSFFHSIELATYVTGDELAATKTCEA